MLRNEEDLSDTIGLIHDAALDPLAWDAALSRCCQLLDGVASQIYGMDLESRDCLYQLDHGLTQQYKQEFALYFSRESERNALHQTRPDLDISYDYLMHDERSINMHDCYRWRQDHGFRYYVGAVLARTPDKLVLANVQRGPTQGHVTETEIATFRLLRGHLTRAVDVATRIADLDMRARSAWEAIEASHVGVVTLDRKGQVRRCNRVTRRILEAGDGIRCEKRRLTARRWIDNAELQRVIVAALGDKAVARNLAIGREKNVRPYSVSVMPVSPTSEFEAFAQDHVLILLNDPDAAPQSGHEMLRHHYGLSARQVDLAMLIAAGNRLSECAEVLGIAEKTARRHLEVIFDRTGLRRQVDLVRLILSLPGGSAD